MLTCVGGNDDFIKPRCAEDAALDAVDAFAAILE